MAKCHDCGAEEGALHELGCDMERCSFCGAQLIGCHCCYELLGIDCSEGSWAWSHGLTAEQEKVWLALLEDEGRVPWIQWPTVCAYCGKLWPDLFMVPDEEWKHYIQLDCRGEVVCRGCWEKIRGLIDSHAL